MRRITLACLLVGCLAGNAAAQPMLRLEGGLSPNYHWRGIRRGDALISQFAGALALVTRNGLAFSAGGRSIAELQRAASNRRYESEFGHQGFTEWAGWVQAEYVRPGWTLAANVERTIYRRPGGNLAVTEAFGRIEGFTRFGAARAEAWYDLSDHRGGYSELSWRMLIANPLTGPLITFELGALAGFAFGKVAGVNGVPDHSGTGLTHGDLGLAGRFTPRIKLFGIDLDLDLDLAQHVEWARDDAAKDYNRTKGRRERFFWLEARAGLALVLPKPVRQ